MILVYLMLGIVSNAIIGVVVLSAIDRDGSLFEWYKSAPHEMLRVVVLELWPLVALAHWYLRR